MKDELLPDDQLECLERLKVGDTQAFTSLYNTFSRSLYRKIFSMIKDEDVAKEILQDLFMKIWLNREKIDLSKSFRAYLNTIASNIVFDHFREVARSRELSQKLVQATISYYTHSEEMLIEKDNLALINTAIDQLPPQRKRIFVMCRLDGKSYQEVSEELSISTSTIRDHMVKANRVVKEYLNRHPDLALGILFALLFR